MGTTRTTPIQIRLDNDIVARLDDLVEPMGRDVYLAHAAAGKFSRSSVARIAIAEGLKALEGKFPPPKPAPEEEAPKKARRRWTTPPVGWTSTEVELAQTPGEFSMVISPPVKAGEDPAPTRPEDSTSWTVEEVAESLKVTKQTVTRWIRRGYIQGQKEGRSWTIDRKSLAAFLDWKVQEIRGKKILLKGLASAFGDIT